MGILEIRAVQMQEVSYSLDSSQCSEALQLLKNQIPDCNYVMYDFRVNHDTAGTCSLGTSLNALVGGVRRAKTLGYKTILRARMNSQLTYLPTNLDLFFSSYGAVLQSVADMADTENVEMLIIGTEYERLETASNDQRFINLVNNLRGVYSGLISYETNWFDTTAKYNNKLAQSWWNTLDFFTISMYLPLISSANIPAYNSSSMWVPSVSELKAGYTSAVVWDLRGQNYLTLMQNLTNQIGKDVLIVCGLASTYGFVSTPWSYTNMGSPAISLQEQANYFQALTESFIPQNNIVGFLVDGGAFTNAVTKNPNNGEFILLNKPAANVLQNAYYQISIPDPDEWAVGSKIPGAEILVSDGVQYKNLTGHRIQIYLSGPLTEIQSQNLFDAYAAGTLFDWLGIVFVYGAYEGSRLTFDFMTDDTVSLQNSQVRSRIWNSPYFAPFLSLATNTFIFELDGSGPPPPEPPPPEPPPTIGAGWVVVPITLAVAWEIINKGK